MFFLKTKRPSLIIRSHAKLLRTVTVWLSCCGPMILRNTLCLPTVPCDRQGHILLLVKEKHRASWSCLQKCPHRVWMVVSLLRSRW